MGQIKLRVGTWNLMRAGKAGGRAGRIAQFVLDWFGMKPGPRSAPAANFSANSVSPFALVSSSSAVSKPSLGERFVEGGTLFPVPTLGGLHSYAPNASLSAQAPASKLEAHGLSIVNRDVDIVFLTEIRGVISEVQKLLFDNAGDRLVFQVWLDDSEQCSIMMVARAKQFLFKSFAAKAVRGVVAAVPNGVPMILFGCHAKSGGGHETQADLATLLQQATEQWGATDGSLSSVAVAIGDFNTQPPDPAAAPKGFVAVREHSFVSAQQGVIRWRAWHPGVPTHCPSKDKGSMVEQWSTLDYLWTATGPRALLACDVAPACPLKPDGKEYGALRRELSDHAPVAYDVLVAEVAKSSVPASLGASFSARLGLLGSGSFPPRASGPTRRADKDGKNPITSFPTEGHGDCGIHALFGKKDSNGVYRCTEVEVSKHRKTIGARIRGMVQQLDTELSRACIQVISERIAGGPGGDGALWKNLGELAGLAQKAIAEQAHLVGQVASSRVALVRELAPLIMRSDAVIDLLVREIEALRAPSSRDQLVRAGLQSLGSNVAARRGHLREVFGKQGRYAEDIIGPRLDMVWKGLIAAGVKSPSLSARYEEVSRLSQRQPLATFIRQNAKAVFEAYAKCTETQGYWLQHVDLIQLAIAEKFTLVVFAATSENSYGAAERFNSGASVTRCVLLKETRDHYEYTQPGG